MAYAAFFFAGSVLQPLRSVQPRETSYPRQNLLFQPMYITPRRVAIAAGLPAASLASSQVRNESALAFCAFFLTLSIQSRARPSLCSLWPPDEQAREIPIEEVPYVARMRAASFLAPALALGEQRSWPW